MVSKMKSFLINRLDERSTWRAVIALLTVVGLQLEPGQAEAIITAGVALGALFEMFLPDPAGNMRKPAAAERVPDDDVQAKHDDPIQRRGPGEPQPRAADRSRQDWLGN